MKKEDESWVNGISIIDGHGIVNPSYTYWTLAYGLTNMGWYFLLK